MNFRVYVILEVPILDKKYELTYCTKLYDLKTLFREIEEDNVVYFSNTLDSLVESLRNKIDLL